MISRLFRTSIKQSALITNRYYVYGQNGRALMGNPEPHPAPEHVFQYHYAFDNFPDQFSGFKYRKRDKYVLHHYFWFETFEFRYDGEWWDIGSLGVNFLWFVFPALLYFIRKYENKNAQNKKGTRSVHFQHQAGMLHDAYALQADPVKF